MTWDDNLKSLTHLFFLLIVVQEFAWVEKLFDIFFSFCQNCEFVCAESSTFLLFLHSGMVNGSQCGFAFIMFGVV
jgi:hypothetical protein